MNLILEFSKYRGVQGIYAIININKRSPKCMLGMPYIGQASAKEFDKKRKLGVGARLCEHRLKLKKNIHENRKLQMAWNKYGEDSFLFLFLEKVDDKNSLNNREQYWMDLWDVCKNGYNCRLIAESSKKHLIKSEIKVNDIKCWINNYKEKCGKFPSDGSMGIVDKQEPVTWHALNHMLECGFRGLPGGSSLSQFIIDNFNVITLSNSEDYTELKTKQWIERFYDENGYYPTKRSGRIVWANEYGNSISTWSSLDACINKKQKGCGWATEVNSLSQFIKKYASRPIKFKSWYKK
jgi:hypothetical protein